MKNKALNQISGTSNTIINIIFTLYSLLCLLPFITVISVSFSDEKAIVKNGYSLVPKDLSLNAYKFLLDDIGQIGRSYGISIVVTVVGTIVSLLLIATYAYPLYRKDFPFRKHFAVFLFITMLFNGGLVPFYVLYTHYLHLKDLIIALILPYLLNPFYVIVMRTFFTSTIPESVVESAKIDGAREIFILFRIVFPMSLPVFATIGLFVTMGYWNDWFMSLLFISKPSNVTIQYYLYNIMSNIQFLANNMSARSLEQSVEIPGETARMAMAVVGIGPIIFAYPFLQRYFIKGLTIGAVKG